MLSNRPSCVLLPPRRAARPQGGAAAFTHPIPSAQPPLPAGLQYLPSPEPLLWGVLGGEGACQKVTNSAWIPLPELEAKLPEPCNS